ncbi:pterocarpan synthase 1-like [Coffea arabica]|uniref:Dirigent protein n=1 Tax=Coffea arabica TaxID=13443 RepID=A0A6P6SAW4_COFAR|nr:dirigent protein 22-like [Coffea arabica]
MAKTLALSTSIPVIVLLLLTVITCIQAEQYQLKETTMSIFFQDSMMGPNATIVAVAGIPGKPRDFFQFGTVFVTDDPITTSIERNSPEIGRGQGMYVTCSLDGKNTYVLVFVVFSNPEYGGSTLELQGRSIQLAPVREVSIVSGTGKFRFARGYATFETVFVDSSTGRSTEWCNISVLY